MKRIGFLLAVGLALSFPAAAAERNALIIGNNAYQHGVPLRNCVNDARAMAAELGACGFAVTLVENGGLQELENKLREFKRSAAGADAAWFFYAGHGSEASGENYLIPVDAKVENQYEVKHKTLALNLVLGAMDESGAALKVVVLDCCRDNPFGRGWSRSGAGGLAQVGETPKGTIIAYATAPGKVAEDGNQANSPFTTALVAALSKPGIDITQVFKETGRAVQAATGDRQNPWVNMSFYGDFVPRSGVPAPAVPAAPRMSDRQIAARRIIAEAVVQEDGDRQQELIRSLKGFQADEIAGLLDKWREGEIYLYDHGGKIVPILLPGAGSGAGPALKLLDNLPLVAGDGKPVRIDPTSAEVANTNSSLRRVMKEIRDGLEASAHAAETARILSSPLPPVAVGLNAEVTKGAAGKSLEAILPGGATMSFRYCPPGAFTMGSPAGEEGRFENENQVPVKISKGFWLARTETTQRQWRALIDYDPSHFKGEDLPVERTSWSDSMEYISRLNRSKSLPDGWKFSLPTEVQWEYACRAGSSAAFSHGVSATSRQANLMDKPSAGDASIGYGIGKSTVVGSYPANGWELHDMHGNVAEWCADWIGETLAGGEDPAGAKQGLHRLMRGGYWSSYALGCRSARRNAGDPAFRSDGTGFRVALVPSR